MNEPKLDVRKLVTMGMLSALGLVFVLLIRVPLIPAAPFLEYDPADIPILVGALIYGPVAGLCMTVAVSAIQAMLLPAIIPFNLIKAGINSLGAFLVFRQAEKIALK